MYGPPSGSISGFNDRTAESGVSDYKSRRYADRCSDNNTNDSIHRLDKRTDVIEQRLREARVRNRRREYLNRGKARLYQIKAGYKKALYTTCGMLEASSFLMKRKEIAIHTGPLEEPQNLSKIVVDMKIDD